MNRKSFAVGMAWIIAAGMLLVAAGQTADNNANAENNIENARDVVVIRMIGHRFEPARVTVQAGQTVRWENESDAVHTVTADPDRVRLRENVRLPEGAATFDSGRVPPGESWSRQFTTPGRYRYVCLPHEEEGMIGEIEVRRANRNND